MEIKDLLPSHEKQTGTHCEAGEARRRGEWNSISCSKTKTFLFFVTLRMYLFFDALPLSDTMYRVISVLVFFL